MNKKWPYFASTKDRTKNSVFWKEDYPCPIRRCSWFYQSNVTGRWVPYSEQLAQEFEAEYNSGFASGSWSRKLELEEPGEYVMFHSSTVMLHFPKASHSKLDDWGQVQPPADPMMKPRVMHRGLEGLPGTLTNTIILCNCSLSTQRHRDVRVVGRKRGKQCPLFRVRKQWYITDPEKQQIIDLTRTWSGGPRRFKSIFKNNWQKPWLCKNTLFEHANLKIF